MNKFDPDLDPNSTADGRAQNRIPSDFNQAATQEGTILNADMINGMVFEIVNALTALGQTPDRAKEDQLSVGLLAKFDKLSSDLGARIGALESRVTNFNNEKIASYQFFASGTAGRGWVQLSGGVINPADFKDNLSSLKGRIPTSWIQGDGRVKLPDANDRVLQYDRGLGWGVFQDDAIRNISGWFGNLNSPSTTSTAYAGGAFATENVTGMPSLSWSGSSTRAGKINMYASNVVPTASFNRERTMNAVLCIYAGEPVGTKSVKSYYLLNPDNTYSGQTIELITTETNDEGIGFNSYNMISTLPDETRNLLGHVQVWDGESWVSKIDFRGKTAYFTQEIELPYYEGGMPIVRDVGSSLVIDKLGDLEDYLTLLAPPAVGVGQRLIFSRKKWSTETI